MGYPFPDQLFFRNSAGGLLNRRRFDPGGGRGEAQPICLPQGKVKPAVDMSRSE
jgi:hypothetical protein